MKKIPALLFALILPLGLDANAARKLADTKAEPKATESPVPELRSVDELRDEIYKAKPNKKLQAVAKANTFLSQQKYPQARKAIQALQSDPIYSDYAVGIPALAHREEGEVFLSKKKWNEALASARKSISLWVQIEQHHPYSSFNKKSSEEIGQAELVEAEALFYKKSLKDALLSYEKAFQRLSVGNGLNVIKPQQLENFSQACKKKPDFLCQSWVQKFVVTYPKHSEEIKAIAKSFLSETLKAKPATPVGKATQTYRAPDLDLAAFDAAMETYWNGKYDKAIELLQKLLDEFPKSTYRHRAKYWLAQAYTQEQEHEKAQKAYEELAKSSPLTYYGLLSAIASGKEMDAEIEALLPQAIANDAYLNPPEALRIKRALDFLAAGLKGYAAQELKEIRARDNLSAPFLMYLATLTFEAGNYGNCFMLLNELLNRNYEGSYSSHLVRLIFPVVYYNQIQKYANLYKLDPILLLSLMKQESAFDPGAVSSSGALGLMQLMPFTASDTEPDVKRYELTDPEINIRIGSKYLKKLVDRFNGNLVYALAGYNGGPHNVMKWIRDGRQNRGMLEFIESIPFKETREYVAAIIRNYYWYSRRLNGDENLKALSYFWNIYGPPQLSPSPPPGQTPASSDGKTEVHNIAVPNDIFFAFQSH